MLDIVARRPELTRRRKLTDWDDDDPSVLQETGSRWDKVVILKHMFTLQELEVSVIHHGQGTHLTMSRKIPQQCSRSKKTSETNAQSSEKSRMSCSSTKNKTALRACDSQMPRPLLLVLGYALSLRQLFAD